MLPTLYTCAIIIVMPCLVSWCSVCKWSDTFQRLVSRKGRNRVALWWQTFLLVSPKFHCLLWLHSALCGQTLGCSSFWTHFRYKSSGEVECTTIFITQNAVQPNSASTPEWSITSYKHDAQDNEGAGGRGVAVQPETKQNDEKRQKGLIALQRDVSPTATS